MTESVESGRSSRRLLILTQFYPPEMGAPQARLSELAEQLVSLGWSVEVLTALPNYPTGRIFPGVSPWRPLLEERKSVRVVRVPMWPAQRGFAKRILAFVSFCASAATLGPAFCTPPSLIWVESPPVFTSLAAQFLACRWGVPYILNISDLWAESAVRMGLLREGTLSRGAEFLERQAIVRASGVTGQAQEIIGSVLRRVPGTFTEVITNGVDPGRFGRHLATAAARDLLGREPGPTFVYAGLLGLPQGLDRLLDLAKELPDSLAGRIVMVGDGPMRRHLVERVESEAIRRVRILPAQERDFIPELLAAADVAVVSLGLHLPGSVPSKIYEAMASELPLLMIAEGEAGQRVSDAHCGLVVRTGDREGLRRAFERLASDAELRTSLGLAGRRAATEVYDRRIAAGRLDKFMRRVAGA